MQSKIKPLLQMIVIRVFYLLDLKMNNILVVAFILNSFILFAQKNETSLIYFKQSECDNSVDARRIKPRIISKEFNHDTLFLKIGFASNCCEQLIPIIKYSDDTLYLTYDYFGELQSSCSCTCCYMFFQVISGIKDTNADILFYHIPLEQTSEKYYTYDIEYKLKKHDTIDYKDKYGLKQGLWLIGSSFCKYKDDVLQSYGSYYSNGKVKDEYFVRSDLHVFYNRFGGKKLTRHGYF